jgi:outer membrane protein W
MKINSVKIKVILFLFLPCIAQSQVYIEGGNTRHRFAQMNLGMDARYFLPNGSQDLNGNQMPSHFEQRMIIGGTHFWGHADFYLAIPVYHQKTSGFKTHVDLGAKIYPWRLENRKVKPYVGVSWLPTSFQLDEGTRLLNHRVSLQSGLTYQFKNSLFAINYTYVASKQEQYFSSPTVQLGFKSQPHAFGISYKRIIETTLSAEKDWISGKTKLLTDTLAKLKRLNGFTLNIGPSSTIFLAKSPYTEANFPFLGRHKLSSVFPEFGIGYYFHNPDLQFNITYRNIKTNNTAYEHSETLRRTAFTLEGYRFVGDYHGFVPFIGAGISYEMLAARIQTPNKIETFTFDGVKPGITFGWDIRPNRLQGFYLRTHLRYFPNLSIHSPTKKAFRLDQLEFNFIQLILFPGRMFG